MWYCRRRGWRGHVIPLPSFGDCHAISSVSNSTSLFKLCVLTGLMQAIKKTLHKGGIFYGALGGVRTHNLLIRSQMLYPIELRVHRFT